MQQDPDAAGPAAVRVSEKREGLLKKKKMPREIGPEWFRWLMFLGGALCMGLGVAIAVLWINFEDLPVVLEWAQKYVAYVPLTALFYALPIFLLGVLLNRLWLSGLIVSVAAMMLALVDYFKTAINGTPLQLADFGLAAQVGEVAGVAGELQPPLDFWRALAVLVICAALLFLFRRITRLTSARGRFLSFSGALVLLLSLFTASGARLVGEVCGIDVYARMPAASNNRFYGLTLALWRDAVMQDAPAPEGYSQEYMEGVLSRIDELLAREETSDGPVTANGEEPNVIFVLSEAFYDLTRLPELEYDSDPLANFHALESEGISGTFHSHYLGYGTGYIEMAMQYGVTNLDFGSSTNICFLEDAEYEKFDALAEQFTNGGNYRAEMFHSYNDSLYNRTVTYPLLGYSDLYFSADIQKMGIQDTVYGGYYMRDAYLFQAMLQRMQEINESGQRAFLFGITMENHQPFDPEKFNYECQIGVSGSDLSEEDMAIVRVMLEGITRADQALGALTDALRETEEPTIVVFFGDHRPNLFMTDGDTVYTKLGLCPDNDTVDWTVEEICDLYSTDYLIWANDPALLRGQEGSRQDSSITAIGPDLLELTGREVSRYWGLLDLVSRESLTNIDLYFVDGEGRPSFSAEDADLSAEARELLKLRSDVIYDAMYGQQYITEQMNQPAGT